MKNEVPVKDFYLLDKIGKIVEFRIARGFP